MDKANYFKTREKDLHKLLKRKLENKKRQLKRTETTDSFMKCP